MIHTYRQVYTLDIVIVGNFNPIILQPFWLASKKLIRDQEAQNAIVELMHPELVRWKLDWLSIEVTQSRLEFRTSQEPYFEPMKDLAISIFDILKETPISALGINHLFYFALPDEARYYEIGNKLAPLNPWKTFVHDPKVMNLEIGELVRADKYKGAYRIRIRPSDIPLSSPYGLLIHINDHYNIEGEDNNMLTVLKDIWSGSCERAAKVCDEIWEI